MIRLISDLHLENYLKEGIDVPWKNLLPSGFNDKEDVLVIAGDLLNFNYLEDGVKNLEFLSSRFREVFWILGNSDFDNSYSEKKVKHVLDKISYLKNIKILDSKVAEFGDYLIIGTTLSQGISKKSQNDLDFLIKNIEAFKGVGRELVVVTHYPPSQALLDLINGVGIRINWISGHLHESKLLHGELLGNISRYSNPVSKDITILPIVYMK